MEEAGSVEPVYPDHWEADVVLADGGTAHLRPVRPQDAELLRAFYARLSAESIYYRFFSPHPQLTEREIVHFTTTDHINRVALIATIGDQMMAVARYDRLPEPPDTPRWPSWSRTRTRAAAWPACCWSIWRLPPGSAG